MEWHVITGSKGGIGKTLLTLLLLAYNLENKKQESTLVLDLSGMNTDSSAMLLSQMKLGNPIRMDLENPVPIQQVGAETIIFQRTYSFDNNKKPSYYIVGYPLNPFGLYNPPLFADLLSTIKKKAGIITKKLGFSSPLRHVIIDTNYHFCNLFSHDEKHYSKYKTGMLENESISIWFLWVYRQFEK
jgi:cellulose biosynthesis protein BcsQ